MIMIPDIGRVEDRYARFISSEYRRKVELDSGFDFADVNRLNLELRSFDTIGSDVIVIDIKAYSGSLPAALKLGRIIESIRSPVYGLVTGGCGHAAFVVLQACNKRLAFAAAFFDVSENRSSFSVGPDTSRWEIIRMIPKMLKGVPMNRSRREEFLRLLATKVSHLSRAELIEIMKQGVHSADQLRALGFIDEVIPFTR